MKTVTIYTDDDNGTTFKCDGKYYPFHHKDLENEKRLAGEIALDNYYFAACPPENLEGLAFTGRKYLFH